MDFSSLLDMAAALAVTALLAESYGAIRRRLAGENWAPMVLGVLFGLMATVQMYNPMEPFEGVLVDMRNVSIALAGAFLGWRGLLPCLLIAVAVRVDLGGVGSVAGVWGMIIAGLAGMIWARKMAHFEVRRFPMLLLLALAMSSHLLGALALPRDMAVWFFTEAAGTILTFNLLAVPLIGALLERENRRIAEENRLCAAMTRDPDSGLLTAAAFMRDLTDAYGARSFGTFAGFVVITPQKAALPGLLGSFRAAPVAYVDRHFLAEHLSHGDLAGQGRNGRILVPLSDVEFGRSNRNTYGLRQALRSGLGPSASNVHYDLKIIDATDPSTFLDIADTLVGLDRSPLTEPKASGNRAALQTKGATHVRRGRIFDPEHHEGLFAKADFLIERSRN